MVQFTDWHTVWDRTADLVKQQAAGVAVYERLNKFLLEFSKLQTEAFTAQKKLCEKYLIDTEKYFGYDSSYAVAVNAFLGVTRSLVDSENLLPLSFELQANGDFKSGHTDQKRRLKAWKHDREKLVTEMKSQVRIIDDEIKRYRDKHRDMVKSAEDCKRIESDKTNSQLDVEKAILTARLKTKDFDRARKDYQAALHQFNLYRREHYTHYIPRWADVGCQLGRERYSRTVTLFNVLFERFRVMLDRLNCVCNELHNVPDRLAFDQDMERLLSHLQTGIPHPGDIAFVDLDATVGTPPPNPDADNLSTVLYPTVSAADLGRLENAGLVQSAANGGQIYAGTGSLYSTGSGGTGSGSASRRPSITQNGGGGPGILRRFFSRRSRSVATANGAGESVYPSESDRGISIRGPMGSQGELQTSNQSRDLLDSSDFSDTSFESEHKPPAHVGEKASAYAETSVLAGLEHLKITDRSQPQSPMHAPLAEPETGSVTYSSGIPNQVEVSNGYESARSSRNSHEECFRYPSMASTAQNNASTTGKINGSAAMRKTTSPLASPPSDRSHGSGMYATSRDTNHFDPSRVSPHKSAPTSARSSQPSEEGNPINVNQYQASESSSHSPQEPMVVIGCCTALYPFEAEGFEPCYLPFAAGDKFHILDSSAVEDTSGWTKVLRVDNLQMGFVPTGYVEQEMYTQPMVLPNSLGSKEPSPESTSHHSPSVYRRNSKEKSNSHYVRFNDLRSSTHTRLPHSPKIKSPIYSRLVGTTVDTDL